MQQLWPPSSQPILTARARGRVAPMPRARMSGCDRLYPGNRGHAALLAAPKQVVSELGAEPLFGTHEEVWAFGAHRLDDHFVRCGLGPRVRVPACRTRRWRAFSLKNGVLAGSLVAAIAKSFVISSLPPDRARVPAFRRHLRQCRPRRPKSNCRRDTVPAGASTAPTAPAS